MSLETSPTALIAQNIGSIIGSGSLAPQEATKASAANSINPSGNCMVNTRPAQLTNMEEMFRVFLGMFKQVVVTLGELGLIKQPDKTSAAADATSATAASAGTATQPTADATAAPAAGSTTTTGTATNGVVTTTPTTAPEVKDSESVTAIVDSLAKLVETLKSQVEGLAKTVSTKDKKLGKSVGNLLKKIIGGKTGKKVANFFGGITKKLF